MGNNNSKNTNSKGSSNKNSNGGGSTDELDALRKNIPGEPGKDYPINSFSIVCKLNPRQCGGGGGSANGGAKGSGGSNMNGKTKGNNQGNKNSNKAKSSNPRSSNGNKNLQRKCQTGRCQ